MLLIRSKSRFLGGIAMSFARVLLVVAGVSALFELRLPS